MAFVGKLTVQNKRRLRVSIATNLPSFLSQMISKICKALLSYYILPIGKKKSSVLQKLFPCQRASLRTKNAHVSLIFTQFAYVCAVLPAKKFQLTLRVNVYTNTNLSPNPQRRTL